MRIIIIIIIIICVSVMYSFIHFYLHLILGHSTETTLLDVLDNVHTAADSKEVILL